jgi:biopolymer transport protein ExbB
MVIAFLLKDTATKAAAGQGNQIFYERNIQTTVENGNIEEATSFMRQTKGSVANAIRSALVKYQDVKKKKKV